MILARLSFIPGSDPVTRRPGHPFLPVRGWTCPESTHRAPTDGAPPTIAEVAGARPALSGGTPGAAAPPSQHKEKHMNKSELVTAVAEKTGESKAAATKFINAITDAVQAAVASGDEVQVPGFGTWKRAIHKGGTARNIATGEPVTYGDTWKVSFSAGEGFKRALKAGPKPVAVPA